MPLIFTSTGRGTAKLMPAGAGMSISCEKPSCMSSAWPFIAAR